MPDTIVALSSGAPPAAIGVIRLSGPQALAAARSIAGTLPAPREARVRRLRQGAETLDQAIVLVFPGPDSATGEDLVEFHVHGGQAVIAAVEGALLTCADVRRAEPGEFTRRALTNGRIDLNQAEAFADLLAAQTQSQHRAAMLASEGLLRRSIDELTDRLVGIAASIELALDFADEDDAGEWDASSVDAELAVLESDTCAWLARPKVEALHRGFRVVIAGRPNRGKSTLFNALAGRDAAIVSPIAGTTRDRIEVPVAHEGVAFVLVDTAGLATDTDDEIEAIGIVRAEAAIETADVLLWLEADAAAPRDDAIRVVSQIDLPGCSIPDDAVGVSGVTGEGLATLWAAIHARVESLMPPMDGTALNQRQHDLLTRAVVAISAAQGVADPLVKAEEVRRARHTLDAITGTAGTEAMLDALFGRFCIGK
ncbi:tRNA uridine-5-carboxymethylaminomethyl(34) synthesis GTPase MnmE [Sphingomonas sp. Y38-1Y]|uniref:tRNA uridine-5-carboxymethylaminomethyl(34) synthesis GTPase MnmE n=1 Tax=Sphingomonas sp. Y38-1Y TaxID=3078265 RepID=UPI0028E44A37|nr:tRNA uridine-5-carboxymethylaminomethyl(34) synthesis GTPase MnmE [Sphingomonas sp. Y38-1Y]